VTHRLALLATTSKLYPSAHIDDTTMLAMLLAAIVHDLGHQGVSNGFQVATQSDGACQFNDQHVAENVALWQSFKLLKTDGMDFMSLCSEETQMRVRRVMIEMVLATDMSEHEAVLEQFNLEVRAVQKLYFRVYFVLRLVRVLKQPTPLYSRLGRLLLSLCASSH
jgi:hypothetical protein